ncbi:MAG: acyltransferase [Zoogloeaceae bacterium]|nr:acyltransferase [Zoogloeaceae bacterium]
MLDWVRRRFELARGGGGHNVLPMEGLRGFAVFLVFLVHYVTLVEPWISKHSGLLALAGALHTIGNTGVDLFFVLSGYLIYGSLIPRRQNFFRFMTRRVERIYPAFLAVFGVYLLLSFVFPNESKIPGPSQEAIIYLLQNFFLLPGLFPIQPMITVAWSLSYEMFYYLAIPLVIVVFRLRARTAAWRTGFFCTVAVAILGSAVLFEGPVRLVMFISGILLCEAMGRTQVPIPNGMLACLTLVLGFLATLLPLPGQSGFALKILFLSLVFFVLCFACFREPSGWLPRSFSWTPLRWLGNMSYSYYLLHGLALKAAFFGLPILMPPGQNGPWIFWGLLPLMFIVTLGASAVLFIAVERPFSLAPRRATGNEAVELGEQRA